MRPLFAFLVGVALTVSGTGCNHNPSPTPALGLDGGDPCSAVCARGRALGCSWTAPTPQGFTCETVCINANDPSGPVRWDIACRISAPSCDAEARCQ